jgi:uncharacterized protein (UPF0335 family)
MRPQPLNGKELLEAIISIEQLIYAKENLALQMNSILSELKLRGYDKKIIQMIIRRRRRPQEELTREEEILSDYMNILGMN